MTLAARVDSFHESPQGEQGQQLLAEIQKRIEKLTEPPPVKAVKALPPPIDPGRKKRGGRRHRKMKERLGMTELRTQANQMKFGQIEEDAYQDAIGYSTGLIGKSGSGKVRAAQVDSKTKAKISQKLQVRFLCAFHFISFHWISFFRKHYNDKIILMEEQQLFIIENKLVAQHQVLLLHLYK